MHVSPFSLSVPQVYVPSRPQVHLDVCQCSRATRRVYEFKESIAMCGLICLVPALTSFCHMYQSF